MPCGVYWRQVNEAEKFLDLARKFGVAKTDPAYQVAYQARGRALAIIGRKRPREVVRLTEVEILERMEYFGFAYVEASPALTKEQLKDARVRIWFDLETGCMAEARFTPTSPPIYRAISYEDALAFITGQETAPLIAKLFHEDVYVGD